MANTLMETAAFAEKMDASDLLLPDPRLLYIEELKALFLKVSKEFTERLAHCKAAHEVQTLETLHNYIKLIIMEIELKDKSALASL